MMGAKPLHIASYYRPKEAGLPSPEEQIRSLDLVSINKGPIWILPYWATITTQQNILLVKKAMLATLISLKVAVSSVTHTIQYIQILT